MYNFLNDGMGNYSNDSLDIRLKCTFIITAINLRNFVVEKNGNMEMRFTF